jgi:hypothetical protein
MRIERIDPADSDVVRCCHAVLVAARAADDPRGEPVDSLKMFSSRLAGGWGEPTEGWYVPAGGAGGLALAGVGAAAWYIIQFPDLENRDRAFLRVFVHPRLERIETGNAAANSYMIAVNEALGYEVVEPGLRLFSLPVN